MERLKRLMILLSSLLPAFCAAASHSTYYGGSLSLPLVPKDPSHLFGYQIMLNFDPQIFKWRQFNVFFDAGFSHFRTNEKPYYRIVNIYSISPVIRYIFKRRGCLLPYLDLSIGAAYLNHTHIGERNLGIHYTFQDRLGIGALFGRKDQFIIGIHALHYSNANLAKHNSGITIPIVLDIGYRFLG